MASQGQASPMPTVYAARARFSRLTWTFANDYHPTIVKVIKALPTPTRRWDKYADNAHGCWRVDTGAVPELIDRLCEQGIEVHVEGVRVASWADVVLDQLQGGTR